MTRLCTLSPSRPASGESLTEMVMARVGGSMGLAGIGVFHRQIAQRVGDGGLLQARNGDDVAGFGALHRHARQAAEGQQLGDAGALDDLAVAVQRLDLAVDGDGAGFDAAGQNAAQEMDRLPASSPAS